MSARLLLSATALALGTGAAAADYTLHIIHINDLHSRVEPVNRFDSTCGADDNAEGKCFGGYARVATKINELRRELRNGNVLVLDAGDQYQGSLMYTTYKGDAEIEFMNWIGFDAMAVGNHEFDDGDEGLAKLADGVSFPVVSGNIDVSRSKALAGKIDNHAVLEVGGERIGIVSALAVDTVETSSPSDGVVFNNEIQSLREDVAMLEARGVDKIIALNHVGLSKDMEIAAAVDGVDAVVGGHSHTLLSNTVEGVPPYPVMVGDTPVVQAHAYSKYVGHLKLVFDDLGNVTEAVGDTIPLDATVAEDPAVKARVAELAGPIEEVKTRVVARTVSAIDGERSSCRAGECQMGNLVADAMLDRVKSQGITIALQNGGGLRASIDQGEVTMGEILMVLPFQGTLSTFTTTGRNLIAALENGVGKVEEAAGRFPQVAGISFTWDPDAAPGSRVTGVMVGGAPIDPSAIYGVVTNNYIRGGGDGYKMFADAADAYDFGPNLADVLAEYMAAVGPVAPKVEGRISIGK